MRGFLLGLLGLSLLEAFFTTQGSTDKLNGGLRGAAIGLDHLMNPNTPLIPDLRK